MKPNLLDLYPAELTDIILSWGEKQYRADQLLNWLYANHIIAPDLMTNLPANFRNDLQKNFNSYLPVILEKSHSQDGTVKYLLQLADDNRIEMVLIPRQDKTTLCVSSQVGCARNCLFCATARIGLIRNLKVSEILAQVFLAQKELAEKKLTNLVFMGMGEPLDNYDNVLKAVRILQDEKAFKFSPRRITISTSGVIPRLEALADSGLKIKLAVSLNSAIQSKREELMPITKKYPLVDLKKTLLNFRRKTPYRITFEYVMIKDFNMAEEDRKALLNFIGDISCKLNLIAWNKVDYLPYEAPDQEEIDSFVEQISKLNAAVTFRSSRGGDINAACGQLAGKYY
jgi:23S rRNA (adenine2503-C2)-methyltransferase